MAKAPFYIVDRDNDFYRISRNGLPALMTLESPCENRMNAQAFVTKEDATDMLSHWNNQMEFVGRVIDADEARRISGEGAQISGLDSGVRFEIRSAIVSYNAFQMAERANDGKGMKLWGRKIKELRHVFEQLEMQVGGAIALYEQLRDKK